MLSIKIEQHFTKRASLCLANLQEDPGFLVARSCSDRAVRDLVVLFLHLLVTVARLGGPGGGRSVLAESVPVRTNCFFSIVLENGRPISVPLIAWTEVRLAGFAGAC